METNDNSWISFSDIMTGLMVIFMFIAIAYIKEVQDSQDQRDEVFEQFKQTKEDLYSELNAAFKDDFAKWQVELDRDLSIKFTNPEILFASGKKDIKPNFRTILNVFLPRYFDILLQEKYRDKISEIRIEGHTDAVPARRYDSDPYIGNVILSQLRSAEVLKHFRNMEYYKSLASKDEKDLQFWLTANGLSYGRTLDDHKQLTIESGNAINNELSRRVEFRIITSSDKVVDKVIEEIRNQ